MFANNFKNLKKLPRFHISLYIIIPFIIMGFTVLAAVLVYNLIRYQIVGDAQTRNLVWLLTTLVAGLSFASGVVLVRLILKPVEQFVEKARKYTPVDHGAEATHRNDNGDPIQRFTYVFDQVTSVLSRMESRHYFPKLIGESLPMRGLMSLVMKVAPTEATVLILGESGTGKELVATSIFEQSSRKEKPFIKLNCAAIPEELLESELFGHEKGAFTGATTFKPGKFDMANGGTIFLDEIGDMPYNLQSKILRVIQEREFYRVGGSKTIKADVRFIASTNRGFVLSVECVYPAPAAVAGTQGGHPRPGGSFFEEVPKRQEYPVYFHRAANADGVSLARQCQRTPKRHRTLGGRFRRRLYRGRPPAGSNQRTFRCAKRLCSEPAGRSVFGRPFGGN